MKTLFAFGLAAVLLTAACSTDNSRTVGVYVLLNVTENHSREASRQTDNARDVIRYLLQSLAPADTLAVASIGTPGFGESDIIAAQTFSQRPSVVNDQKRAFRDRFDRFIQKDEGSPYSDICGGLLQAIETLNRSGPARKTILILSNLKEKPTFGTVRDLPFQMTGIDVVILKNKGLRPNSREMKLYRRRLENLRVKVEGGNARFLVIDDLQQLGDILRPARKSEKT